MDYDVDIYYLSLVGYVGGVRHLAVIYTLV